MNFASYDTAEFFDEMFLPDGCARFGARLLKERIESLPNGESSASPGGRRTSVAAERDHV